MKIKKNKKKRLLNKNFLNNQNYIFSKKIKWTILKKYIFEKIENNFLKIFFDIISRLNHIIELLWWIIIFIIIFFLILIYIILLTILNNYIWLNFEISNNLSITILLILLIIVLIKYMYINIWEYKKVNNIKDYIFSEYKSIILSFILILLWFWFIITINLFFSNTGINLLIIFNTLILNIIMLYIINKTNLNFLNINIFNILLLPLVFIITIVIFIYSIISSLFISINKIHIIQKTPKKNIFNKFNIFNKEWAENNYYLIYFNKKD